MTALAAQSATDAYRFYYFKTLKKVSHFQLR